MQKKLKYNRGFWIHTSVAAGLILFIALFGAAVFFRVKHIDVTGGIRYSPDDVRGAAKIKTGDILLLFGKKAAEKRIIDELPYIGDIKISRRLPGTLLIEITEREPSAITAYGGNWWIIDRDGQILEKVSYMPLGLTIIEGITPRSPEVGRALSLDGDASGVRCRALLTLLGTLEDAGISARVSYVDISNVGAITFTYEDRITVSIGAISDAESKVGRFTGVLDKIDAGFRGRIDVTGTEAHAIPDE